LLVFGVLLAFMETVLYTALSPLIPELARELSLSATQVGTMTAAYPAGLVVASVPVGYAASRGGPRVTAVVGLWVLAFGSLLFALMHSAVELDVARFLQGAGSAAAWGGALAWLAAAYPLADRGGAIGIQISAAFLGILLGPAIGAVAASAGRQGTFTVIGVGLALVALWGGPRRASITPRSSREHVSLRSFRHPALLASLACVVALGVLAGTLTALGPLLLAERGLGASAIAACFICAAGPQLLFTSALGRRLGRSGLLQFCIAMMLLSALLLPLTTVPTGQVMTAVLFSVVVGVEFITFNPLLLLTSSVAERLDRSQGLAMSLANGAWGLGAAAGGLCLARLADATSISGGFLAAGLIALTAGATLAAAMRAGVL
jgi:MFS family permease